LKKSKELTQPIHPAGLIPFPFAYFGHLLIAFFFSVFSFEKYLFREVFGKGGKKKTKESIKTKKRSF
jgi:hypothetical protein